MTFVLILLIILAIVIGFGAVIYNKLVKADNERKRSLAQIDVQLKRRYDLIPNLVESVRAYMAHESSTLEDVIKARNSAAQARDGVAASPSPDALAALASADGALTGMLGRLMMLTENYPNLKADETVKKLMNELSETENLLSGVRSSYNQAVKEYNQTIELFPNVLLSSFLGYRQAASWTLSDQAEAEPVRFALGPKTKN
jgi:LemA protein